MSVQKDFERILEYAHFWNWCPDWDIVRQIYDAFPDSYSVLTPFAYTYLEELISSMTSNYGQIYKDDSGNISRKTVGRKLVELAIDENRTNKPELAILLEKSVEHFSYSLPGDTGDNRNSVQHGYMHPRFWDKTSFENLIEEIADLSVYAGF